MRKHVLGWAILGIAALALPPAEPPKRPRAASGEHGVATSASGEHGIAASADAMHVIPAPASPPIAVSATGSVPAAGSARPARRLLAAAPKPPARSATNGGASWAAEGGIPVMVRELAPGSKAHAQAIASHIASAQMEDLLSPVARLYLAYFGRAPDYEGLDYYAGERDRGEPLDAIAEEFARSDEFEARYGSLDNAAFVERVLQNIFGFPGDAAQVAYWVDQIESGRMTRGQVMLVFSESPGYRAMTANEVFVAMAYAETLGRAPEPADLIRWVRYLDAGNPRRALIDVLLADRGKG